MQKDALDRISAIVTSADVAMLTTEGADGTLHARPLAVLQKTFERSIRFLIEDPSPKVEEIRANPRVNVSFASKKGFLSLAGSARLVEGDDAAIDDLWGPAAEAWFPGGRQDPEIVVLEVLPDSAEYWAKTDTGIVAAAKVAKAFFTKQEPDVGENRTVEF
jgi:general stress protein 26